MDMEIKLNDNMLQQNNTVDYLDVTIDDKLSWNKHIDRLANVLYFKVSKLSRLRKFMPIQFVHQMYNSIIQPSIYYAIIVRGSSTEQNVNKIQRIQNLAARIVSGNFDYINTRGLDIVHSLG